MKLKFVHFGLVVLCIVAAGPASGNPPNAIHTSYDAQRGELEVTVQHPVTNRHKHYISEVILIKNGKEVEKRTFDFQTSRRNETTYPFKIQVAPGDDVRVRAICYLFGEGEAQVKIQQAE
ncbi:MAG: hypothetical protein WC956_01540 [bacterium]